MAKKKTKKAPVKQAVIKKAPAGIPAEWLYMTEKEISVKQIAAAFAEKGAVEVWEEAGVVEVILGEKASMDMELTETDLGDEVGNEFLEAHQIKTLFLVTIPAAEYTLAEAAMRKITAATGGFFCGDTEDFTPVVK